MSDQEKPAVKSLSDVKSGALQLMPDMKIDVFSQRGFELAQRVGRAFATSDAVPAAFRSQVLKKSKEGDQWIDNPSAIGNCLVAIETAQSIGMSITAVMQNANIIEGKLSWSGQFKIGAVNASHRFTPLRYDIKNKGMMKATYKEKDGWNKEKNKYNMVEHTIDIENLVCVAWALPAGMPFPPGVYTFDQAKAAGLPVIEGPPVSMKLAVEEGWYAKPGSKWQTEMKHKMLTIRAGAYFSDIHAPDVVMGMGRTSDELEDMSIVDVERQPNGQYAMPQTLDELRKTAEQPESHPEAETVVVKEEGPATTTETKLAESETETAKTDTVAPEAKQSSIDKNAAAVEAALGIDPAAPTPRRPRAKTNAPE